MQPIFLPCPLTWLSCRHVRFMVVAPTRVPGHEYSAPAVRLPSGHAKGHPGYHADHGLRLRAGVRGSLDPRSEEHTSELQSLMRISYAVFCLKKKKQQTNRMNKTQEHI